MDVHLGRLELLVAANLLSADGQPDMVVPVEELRLGGLLGLLGRVSDESRDSLVDLGGRDARVDQVRGRR